MIDLLLFPARLLVTVAASVTVIGVASIVRLFLGVPRDTEQ